MRITIELDVSSSHPTAHEIAAALAMESVRKKQAGDIMGDCIVCTLLSYISLIAYANPLSR